MHVLRRATGPLLGLALVASALAVASPAHADAVLAGEIVAPSVPVASDAPNILFEGTGATEGATISLEIDGSPVDCAVSPDPVVVASDWQCQVDDVPSAGEHVATATAEFELESSEPTAEFAFTVLEPEPDPEPIEGCTLDDDSDYGGRAVTIGSWNITSSNASRYKPSAESPGWKWEARREGVIDMLAQCGADVYTLQEASASRTPIEEDSYPDTVTQYEQVVTYLNARFEDDNLEDQYEYAMVDASRDTCGRSGGEFNDPNCVPSPLQAANPGGEGGIYDDHPDANRIIYNVHTVTPEANGWRNINSGGKRTTAAWAQFSRNGTDTRFFVATTHIDSKLKTYGKRKQIKKALYMIKSNNTEKLATILTGDFNSHRYQKNSAAKTPVTSDLKFIEITGQDFGYKGGGKYGSCSVPKSNRNKYRVPYKNDARKHSWFNTTTGSSTKNHCKKSWKYVGTSIDFIYTTKNIRPRTWRTVVNPGSDRGSSYSNVYGYPAPYVTPSDHNLLVTKLKIYPSEAW